MPRDDFKEFIKNAKTEYKKIGHVECPAFRGERVYFTKDGFTHLLRKGSDIRPDKEQLRRLKLLPHAASILRGSKYAHSQKLNIVDDCPAYFWTFSKTINSIPIRVVVRQLGNGRKHFFSIMDEIN